MKKHFLTFWMLALAMIVGCTSDRSEVQELNADPNFRVFENNSKNRDNANSRESLDVPCDSTDLMAGQFTKIGIVTTDIEGNDLKITYSTVSGWSIDLTHLSIGDCTEQWVPTTGSGNPKIGHFEHSQSHSGGVNEVVYLISLDVLTEEYCFAAHAEVTGPNGGETAWADGEDFDGNSWATFARTYLSYCDVDGEGPGGR